MSKSDDTKLVEQFIKLYFSGKLRAKYNNEKRRSEQEYSPQGIKYSHGSGGKTNNVSNEIEQYMASKDKCAQLASFLKLLIDELEEALGSLIIDDCRDDYNILKWTYQKIPKMTDEDIAAKLEISVWTVRSRRSQLIEEIGDLVNVEYYVDNPIGDIAEFFRKIVE